MAAVLLLPLAVCTVVQLSNSELQKLMQIIQDANFKYANKHKVSAKGF